MALSNFSYTKTWRSATDFSTIETDETQVRDDMQCLYDEIASGLNGLINGLNNGGIDTANIADGAVDTSKLADGAVTLQKLDGEVKTVFWAEYGSTTAAKLYEAYTAGKEILCKYDGYVYRMSQRNSAGLYYFVCADPTQTRHRLLTCDSGNVWHNANYSFAPKNNAELTGAPKAPTPSASDNSTRIATTAFVQGHTIDNSHLDDNSVSSAKIQPGAVTSLKIASGNVNTLQLADGAVTEDKLDVDAVVTSRIKDKAVTKAKLAAAVQTSLGKADTAYQKPMLGIPKTDLSAEVQDELGGNVFFVTYGTTTVAQIDAAVTAGKLPVLKYQNRWYSLVSGGGMSLGSYTFTCLFSDGMLYWARCELASVFNPTGWTSGSKDLSGGDTPTTPVTPSDPTI